MQDYLMHHGRLGQKWGDRNGPPYPLGSSQVSAAERRAEKKDLKWAKKNGEKIQKKTAKKSAKEIEQYRKQVLNYNYSSVGKAYINAYNKKYAEIMNKNVGTIEAPSGRVVQFVAKRGGQVGVYLALTDPSFDMSTVKNGVWSNGRVAYKKDSVDMR